ncbi:hypothetical protein HCUR_01000 [Holospora curviuscula]|uniref:Uncharacterized protein n=2 Tax=Holospora curviuscula TaxID=1082868 RepID=A0A2S5R8F9_9PROT|nr:hypothetical protein HCUR_01000 [Holospora curviuscula]
MDCLEHDITINPDAYQPEQAEHFWVSAIGIAKALRCLGVRYKQTKGGSRKKICIVLKASRIKQ